MNDHDLTPPGVRGTPGWIDPATAVRRVQPPQPLQVAALGARLIAVVIDFVCLKALTSLAALAVAGIAIPFALGSGDDPRVAVIATASVLVISFVTAVLYFVVFPGRQSGVTVGRRIAGISPRYVTGDPVSATLVARHDVVLFVVPTLLLDPIGIFGFRDFAVVIGWCLFQAVRTVDGATLLERSLGFKLYETRWNS